LYNVNELSARLKETISTGESADTIVPFWYFYCTVRPNKCIFSQGNVQSEVAPYIENLPMKI
jgi:hypothetical protein